MFKFVINVVTLLNLYRPNKLTSNMINLMVGFIWIKLKTGKKKIIKFVRPGELINNLGNPTKPGRYLFFQMCFSS
jgi:hypothetical protein